MKTFIKKIILFFIPLVFIFYIKPIYLLINDKYKDIVAGKETYISIKKSKETSNKKIILIGDSVARQLFDNTKDNDSINSLANNQAIGVIGQYILLYNYLEAGNRPQEVFMLYTPFSFQNNLNQIFTFHYFLKPFYKKEYMNLFSNTVIQEIDKIPFSNFCHEPYILTSNWAPNFKSQETIDYSFLSPISKEYLIKIKKLCLTNNIEFYLIPTPTKEGNKEIIENFIKSEFLGLIVENDLHYFLNNINYLPDSLFMDKVHLKTPKNIKNNVLNEMNKARIQGKGIF